MTKEKSPLQSRKFIAYLLAELTWKAIIIFALLTMKDTFQDIAGWGWWFLIVTVIVAGFLEVGFIGGQAWLDKYVRVAEIAAKKPAKPDDEPGQPVE